MNKTPTREELLKLVNKWRARARGKFRVVEKDKSSSLARRVIEHGARCYEDCAEELEDALVPEVKV